MVSSQVIDNERHPKWNEEFQLLVHEPEHQVKQMSSHLSWLTSPIEEVRQRTPWLPNHTEASHDTFTAPQAVCNGCLQLAILFDLRLSMKRLLFQSHVCSKAKVKEGCMHIS